MKTLHNSQTKLSKKNTKIGFLLGVITGLVIGLTASVTMLTVSGGGLSFATGVVLVFTLAFAVGGAFMGLLFDVDARERNIGAATNVQPEPRFRNQVTLQPSTRYVL